MKRILSYFYPGLLVVVLLIGCDKVDELNTIEFNSTFTGDVECTVPAAGKAVLNPTFSGSVEIVPTSDPNVNLYLTNIQSYEIKSVKATITSLSQDNVTIVSADLTIKNFQHTAVWLWQNELLSVGKTITLANENGQWDTVSKILKDGQEFTVIATGETDFAGITFTIKVDIETNVTAKAI